VSACLCIPMSVCLSVCQLVTDTDVSCQVIAPATSAQMLNAGVVNSLYKFHQAVSKVSSVCLCIRSLYTELSPILDHLAGHFNTLHYRSYKTHTLSVSYRLLSWKQTGTGKPNLTWTCLRSNQRSFLFRRSYGVWLFWTLCVFVLAFYFLVFIF